MNQTNQKVQERIATLPMSDSERDEALAYVQDGEDFADAVLAIIHFFTPPSAPTLRHTH